MTIASRVHFCSQLWFRAITLIGFLFVLSTGCSRSAPVMSFGDGGVDTRKQEICDGLDNNQNGRVDEGYRTDGGVYLNDDHCGACNQPCTTDSVTLVSACQQTEYGPACRSIECVEGYVATDSPMCVSKGARLCASCLENEDCGAFEAARCVKIAGENRCSVTCSPTNTCPTGYRCSADGICVPPSNSCSCYPGDLFDVACTIEVNGEACLGTATCDDGVLSGCSGTEEVCDGIDNDCNGIIDDPFVGDNGFYGVDIHNCGSCGVDCTLNPVPEQDIACAGPATSPVCAIQCQDTIDGIDVGDRVDADLQIHNLCECTVTSLEDNPATGDADGSAIDSNCDGADGVVSGSFYVLPGGNDLGPGSPIKPMGSIGAAVEAAHASLDGNAPRPFVFVAAGSYDEVLTVREGVRIYGGYSPDFNTRNPVTYPTEIHPESWELAFGGAALVAESAGLQAETVVDGVTLKGASAPGGKDNYAIGAVLIDSGKYLLLQNCTIISGDGADGKNGDDGIAGVTPTVQSGGGDLPRAAVENPAHRCISNKTNTVQGGISPLWTCGGIDVSGGAGGDSGCPRDTLSTQPDGEIGNGPKGTPGGAGGTGGSDAEGPIFPGTGSGCRQSVCCGLADFLVDTSYKIAGNGNPGRAGADGDGGAGCTDPLGKFQSNGWTYTMGKPGSSGGPGSGGGGGGAGGGAAIEWVVGDCPYPDGLGGGGGAGGSGGCGGSGGASGTSGGPSVGIFLSYSGAGALLFGTPNISNVTFIIGNGGHGGHGGHGGDGGQGGAGAKGGALLPEERIIPPLSGATSGGRGGSGGSGGAGGGGGGGCGGSSIAIWAVAEQGSLGSALADYQDDNAFKMGNGGAGGDGGGGGNFGKAGKQGEVRYALQR